MAPPRLPAFKSEHVWRGASEPTFWLDKALRIAWVNRAWETLTGHSAETVLGTICRSHAPMLAGDVSDLAASFHPPAQVLAGFPAGSPALIIHKQGEKLWRHLDFWPFHGDEGQLLGILGRVREASPIEQVPSAEGLSLHDELLALRKRLGQRHGFDALIGQGPVHDRLLEQVRLAGSTSASAIIVGEPGTGKRSVARAIHDLGPNRHRAIDFVDCQSLPAEWLERRLFVPTDRRDARFHAESPIAPEPHHDSSASEQVGMIVIGDILHLPRDLQARLAAWLGMESRPRVLATTAGDLEALLRSERIRHDLYYALTPLIVRLAPLRERRGEILLLAQHFLERANRKGGPQKSGFAPGAQAALLAYDWPGNLFELDRVVNHARQRGERSLIDGDDLPSSIRGNLGAAYTPPALPPPFKPLDELLTEIERRLIESALQKARRNKSRAADLLGISRPRLYRRMKELNLAEEADAEEESGPAASVPPEE